MKSIRIFVAALAAVSFGLGAASAATITTATFNGSSNFVDINDPNAIPLAPPGEINIGITFDAATPDLNPEDTSVGLFATIGGKITVGSEIVNFTGGNINIVQTGGISFTAATRGTPISATFDNQLFGRDLVLVQFGIPIRSLSASFVDDSLPTSLPPFTLQDMASLIFAFETEEGFFDFIPATLTLPSDEPIGEVPLPAAASVFLVGMAGLGSLQRKRKNA